MPTPRLDRRDTALSAATAPARPRRSTARHAALVVVLAAATTLALSACAPDAEPLPSSASPTVQQSAEPSATPAPTPEPSFVAGGSAADNLPIFQRTLEGVWNGTSRTSARPYAEALIAAGFDPGAMQLTGDTTPNGNLVDAVEVSVLVGGECLVGQASFAGNALTAVVLPAIPGDICLTGTTVPVQG